MSNFFTDIVALQFNECRRRARDDCSVRFRLVFMTTSFSQQSLTATRPVSPAASKATLQERVYRWLIDELCLCVFQFKFACSFKNDRNTANDVRRQVRNNVYTCTTYHICTNYKTVTLAVGIGYRVIAATFKRPNLNRIYLPITQNDTAGWNTEWVKNWPDHFQRFINNSFVWWRRKAFHVSKCSLQLLIIGTE